MLKIEFVTYLCKASSPLVLLTCTDVTNHWCQNQKQRGCPLLSPVHIHAVTKCYGSILPPKFFGPPPLFPSLGHHHCPPKPPVCSDSFPLLLSPLSTSHSQGCFQNTYLVFTAQSLAAATHCPYRKRKAFMCLVRCAVTSLLAFPASLLSSYPFHSMFQTQGRFFISWNLFGTTTQNACKIFSLSPLPKSFDVPLHLITFTLSISVLLLFILRGSLSNPLDNFFMFLQCSVLFKNSIIF